MNISHDWVVGFTDGEGCFFVGINKHSDMKVGYQILPEFRIVQHRNDVQVLHALKSFFGCGVVRNNHEDRDELRIRKLENLLQVVEFFEKHPLKTKKNVDFKKFARVVRWMEKGEHLTKDGLIKIIELACTMNRGDKPQAEAILQDLMKHKG
jgi:hypothetical protein